MTKMRDNNINNLFRTDNKRKISAAGNKKLKYSKEQIIKICESLSYDADKFNPEVTYTVIKTYTKSSSRLPRVLYSEITNYVYSLSTEERGGFATNIDKLLEYATKLPEDNANELQEMVIRIYDHCQLALSQCDNVKDSFIRGVEDTKQELKDQFKGIEREYVSILGIFSSIILAFTGGMTFTTSILNNINRSSIYRLVIVSCIAGLVCCDLIYIIIDFIERLNEREEKNKAVILICNLTFAVIIAITALAYVFK